MSYSYASFQAALALEMVVPNANVNDPNFVAILPTIVDYAEQRCYRELDLLTAEARQWFAMTPYQRSQTFSVNNVVLSIQNPPQQILVVERVKIWPANEVPSPPPVSGPPVFTGEPAFPTSVDYLDAVYSGIFPNPGPMGRPVNFALLDDQTLAFGPMPDQAYLFEIHGSARPVPLYNALGSVSGVADGTQTTFLTQVLPDLFLAAAMVSASGYRKNYGAQADDPRMAVSWESQYNELLGSAKTEEVRKRFLGWGMMSSYPAPPMPAPAPAG
jgi:hypothetical protein